MLERTPVVLCDFDDTVVLQNVAELLLERFGNGRWKDLRRQCRQKLISFREYQERAFRDIQVGPKVMADYVREQAVVRPGFQELWGYCRVSDVPLAIVTLGLDFYVEAVLNRDSLAAVPTYTVKTKFTSQGVQYQYPHTWDGCVRWGICKCAVLESYRAKGYDVVYVGDGASDLCPASRANLVFARSTLAERCHQEGVPHLQFSDFHDVLGHLRQMLGEGVRA